MAYSRGYHSYRGRTPKWRIVLTIVLTAVILAAIAVILLSRNIVYDEDGSPRLELPWQDSAPQEDTPLPEVDLTIEPSQAKHTAVRAVLLPAPLTAPLVDETLAACGDNYSSVAVTLKDGGSVYFDSTAALPGTVAFTEENAAGLDAALAAAKERGGHAVARIACFHDPKAANGDVEGMGLKNTGGYIFYDGNNSQWLDPGKEKARDYLKSIITEAAAKGFTEILLTDVSYPTAGKLDKIDLSNAQSTETVGGDGRTANLAAFLREVRAVLPEGVTLSLELDADTIRAGAAVNTGGQALTELAPLVDRIYAPATAEETSALAEAVSTASERCGFVPELTAAAEPLPESCLLLAQ